MASQGPLSPGTLADDSSVGTVAWSNVDNAKVSDNSYATKGTNNTNSHYLKATNFGFSIPSGATIDGIVVEVEGKKGSSVDPIMTDNAVRIVKGGTVGSTDKSGATWSTTEGYKTYGSSSELWGETWSVNDINSSDFGFAFSVFTDTGDVGTTIASIDHIRITIHYTEGEEEQVIGPFPTFLP